MEMGRLRPFLALAPPPYSPTSLWKEKDSSSFSPEGHLGNARGQMGMRLLAANAHARFGLLAVTAFRSVAPSR
jgi:hypothetical protein